MEGAGFSQTLVTFCQSVQRIIIAEGKVVPVLKLSTTEYFMKAYGGVDV
jgi:hypothetical protein